MKELTCTCAISGTYEEGIGQTDGKLFAQWKHIFARHHSKIELLIDRAHAYEILFVIIIVRVIIPMMNIRIFPLK